MQTATLVQKKRHLTPLEVRVDVGTLNLACMGSCRSMWGRLGGVINGAEKMQHRSGRWSGGVLGERGGVGGVRVIRWKRL